MSFQVQGLTIVSPPHPNESSLPMRRSQSAVKRSGDAQHLFTAYTQYVEDGTGTVGMISKLWDILVKCSDSTRAKTLETGPSLFLHGV